MKEGLASRIKKILSFDEQEALGPKRAHVIAVSNQKGGVGKTTTAVNLGAALALFRRYKVLLIDLDAQGHVSPSLQQGYAENGNGISTVLSSRNASLLQAVVPTDIECLDITLSDRSLLETESQLAAKIGREFILRKALATARTFYDFIIIDCPPNLGNLTVNAYVAADYLIIPCEMSALALDGMESVLDTVETVNYRLNHSLKILGILPTRVDHRNTVMNATIQKKLEDYFGARVFKSQITVNTDLNKSQLEGQPIFLFAPSSTGAADYKKFAEEVLERLAPVSLLSV